MKSVPVVVVVVEGVREIYERNLNASIVPNH